MRRKKPKFEIELKRSDNRQRIMFKRRCRRCGKMFLPDRYINMNAGRPGKFFSICNKCNKGNRPRNSKEDG